MVDKLYYTYDDWLLWDENVRNEIIDGEIYEMDLPTVSHQNVLAELLYRLANFVQGKTCKVFPSRTGVRLDEDTVVQPDIIVVCDMEKLKNGKVCMGAPDLVVEVLSPSTAKFDKSKKHSKYIVAGVREVWFANPDTKTVEVHILENGRGNKYLYRENDHLPVHVLEGCVINLSLVFEGVM